MYLELYLTAGESVHRECEAPRVRTTPFRSHYISPTFICVGLFGVYVLEQEEKIN